MPTAGVDVVRVVKTLLRHRVKFVVIGGFAIELHDVAVPPTRDIDITPATGRANLNRAAAALNELGARFRVPGGPANGVAIPGGLSGEWLQEMVSVALVTESGPVDVSLRPDGTDGYADMASGSTEIPYEGIAVPTAALEVILRSKEAAGRPKDIKVIPAIRDHLRRRQD